MATRKSFFGACIALLLLAISALASSSTTAEPFVAAHNNHERPVGPLDGPVAHDRWTCWPGRKDWLCAGAPPMKVAEDAKPAHVRSPVAAGPFVAASNNHERPVGPLDDPVAHDRGTCWPGRKDWLCAGAPPMKVAERPEPAYTGLSLAAEPSIITPGDGHRHPGPMDHAEPVERVHGNGFITRVRPAPTALPSEDKPTPIDAGLAAVKRNWIMPASTDKPTDTAPTDPVPTRPTKPGDITVRCAVGAWVCDLSHQIFGFFSKERCQKCPSIL